MVAYVFLINTHAFVVEYSSTNVSCKSGLDLKNIEKCMGDPEADSDNQVLKEEQDAQVSITTKFWK